VKEELEIPIELLMGDNVKRVWNFSLKEKDLV
jgi:hypothetical protein